MREQLSFNDVTRPCSLCAANKPESQYGRDSRGGRSRRCLRCSADVKARYRAAHPEKVKKATADWNARHAEKHQAWARAYREANRERVLTQKRAYYQANRERHLAKVAAWYASLPQETRAAMGKHAHAVRTARRMAVPAEPIPAATIQELLTDPCVYCGSAAQEIDHVRPLSRGGAHALSNLVPACKPCNRSKNARLLTDWDPSRVSRAAGISSNVLAELARLSGEVTPHDRPMRVMPVLS